MAMVHEARKVEEAQPFTLEYHVMHEALQNMATVQAFCMEDQERSRFQQATSQMRSLAIRSAFYSNLVSPVTEVTV